MSSRKQIIQTVSNTEPVGAALGDEWFQPSTNKLFKRMIYSGVVGWTEIPLAVNSATSISFAGGSANQILYQTTSSQTGFVTAPVSASTFLYWTGSAFAWSSQIPKSAAINTVARTTSATHFLTFVDSNNPSAAGEALYTTSSFSINPATGEVTSTGILTALELRQTSSQISIGNESGVIHRGAGVTSIGYRAGYSTQTSFAVAVGYQAGSFSQGSNAVSVGYQAGETNQGTSSVALGTGAGRTNQRTQSIAIGNSAASTNQSTGSIAIGFLAGGTNQGSYAIAIGYGAASTNQPTNSIVLNTDVNGLNVSNANSFYVNPIRADATTSATTWGLYYNPVTKEVTTSSVGQGASSVQTTARTTNAAHYVTFVDSNNTNAAAETVYTTSTFTINPSNGNVVIPGELTAGGTITSGQGVSTGDVRFELGGNRTGAGPSYIDFHSTASTDFEARIIRYGGVNGGLDIVNNGTGTVKIASSNAPIQFLTNSAERMTVAADGRVGIGTMFPNATLHVRPTTNVNYWVTDANTTTLRTLAINDLTSSYLDWRQDANQHLFFTSNSERMRIDASGNVGIGLASPSYALHVKGTNTITTVHVIGGGVTTAPTPSGTLTIDTLSNGVARTGLDLSFTDGSGSRLGGFKFSDTQTSGDWVACQMEMVQSFGAANQIVSRLQAQDAGHAGMRFISQTNTGTALTTSPTFIWSNATTEQMRIDSSGNVGIGTTSIARRLHVYTTGASGVATFESNQSLSAIALKDTGTSVTPQIGSAANDLFFQTNGSETARLTSAGNFGIGVASPASKLHVSGDARITGITTVSNTTAASSTTTGALQVSGGAGIGGNLYVGGTIFGTINATVGSATNIAGGTAGQLVYQSGVGTTAFAGPGTAGQLLRSNGTSAPSYVNTSSIFVGNAASAVNATNATNATNIAGGAAGRIPIQSDAGATTFIPTGTAGQLLQAGTNTATFVNTSSLAVAVSGITTNIAGGATGSIPYQNAANSTRFIPIGSNGQVLTSNGTTATWATPAGGSTVETTARTTNANHFLTFVDSNNASATAETVYTTSSFFINPSNGAISVGGDISANTAIVTGNNTNGWGRIVNVSSATYFQAGSLNSGSATAQPFIFTNMYGAGERMRLNAAGGLSVGTSGGDFSRNWRFVARQDQNASSEFGFINATAGASSSVNISRIGGTGNNFCDWRLSDGNGTPFDTFEYGSAVTYARWVFGGNERVRITSDGNVGIGTAAPGTRLDVSSTSSPYIRINTTSGANKRAGIIISQSNTPQYEIGVDTNVNNTRNLYVYDAVSATFRMVFDSAGNVGINNSSPLQRLSVRSSGRGTDGIIVDSAAAGNPWLRIIPDASAGAYNSIVQAGDALIAYSSGTVETGALSIAPWSAGTSGIRIQANGNVGIGAISPSTTLEVNGDVTIADKIIHAGDTNTAIRFPANDTISFETAGGERARITSTGGFAVGTTSDPGAGAIHATGNITAYFSDQRLKTVVGSIDNALEKLNKITGIYYINNDVAKQYGYVSEEVQVGVLAQDVESVLPEIVKPAPFDLDENNQSKSGENYKTLQYEKLVPLLIEAIKEQQTVIETQNEKLNNFELKLLTIMSLLNKS